MRFLPAFVVCALGAGLSMVAAPLSAKDATLIAQGNSDQAAPQEQSESNYMRLLKSLQDVLPAPVEPFDPSKSVIGFAYGVNEDGAMYLERVLPRSAAESAGLDAGMVILRINGIAMRGFTLREIGKILNAIDGEIMFDVEGRGRYSLIKAPIPDAAPGDAEAGDAEAGDASNQ